MKRVEGLALVFTLPQTTGSEQIEEQNNRDWKEKEGENSMVVPTRHVLNRGREENTMSRRRRKGHFN